MNLLPFNSIARKRAVITLIAIACSIAICLADDGAVTGVGGSVELIKGSHPSIRMVDELVQIDRFPKGRVRARFVFRNEGPATDVEMGFPVQAAGPRAAVSKEDASLQGFKSWVDGKPVKVKHSVSSDDPEDVDDRGFSGWYVKRVHFAAGQTRVVEDSYTAGGQWSTSGDLAFIYILQTGASWKGSIGHARVVCDLTGIGGFSPFDIRPDGYHRKGLLVTWDWKNLKPNEDGDIQIGWFPAFLDISLNGEGLDRANMGEFNISALGRKYDSYSLASFCRLRDHAVLVPAELAAYWLGGKLEQVGKKRFRIIQGKRWVDFETGSSTLVSSSGHRTPMEFPASVMSGRDLASNVPGVEDLNVHMIGFAALVEALGGKAKLDRDRNGMDLWLDSAKKK